MIERNTAEGLSRYRSYLDRLFLPPPVPPDGGPVTLTRPCILCGRSDDHSVCLTRKAR